MQCTLRENVRTRTRAVYELVSVQNASSCSTAITSQQYYTLQQQAEQSSSIINTYQLIISNWMSKLRIMRETTGGVHIRENLPHESSYTYVVRRIVMRWSQPASQPASILWFTTALREVFFWQFCVSLHISIVPFWRLKFDGTSRFHQSIDELVDDEANENFEEVPPNPEYADPAATKTNWQHTIMAYSWYSQDYKACTWADHDHSIIRIKHLIIAGKRGALDRTSCLLSQQHYDPNQQHSDGSNEVYCYVRG